MNTSSIAKYAIAILFLLLSIFYPNVKEFLKNKLFQSRDSINDHDLKQAIVKSWKKIIVFPESHKELSILLGLNTNVDLIVKAKDIFANLQFEEHKKPANHRVLNSLDQFREAFLFFFKKGHAAERFISNAQDFEKLINATEYIEKKWFIGGNAALMAQNILNNFPTTSVSLIGPIGPILRSLLNKQIATPEETMIHIDEIHLIIEYSKHEHLEDKFHSPRANRFIVSNDLHNSEMQMLELFLMEMTRIKNDVTIISGLHLLENQDHAHREKVLTTMATKLHNLNTNSVIHLELASMGNDEFMKEILSYKILEQINSLGLNEQELLFMSHAAKGVHSNYFHDSGHAPDFDKIIDIIEWIFMTHGNKNKDSKLTRVHFHYLLYHIVAISDDKKWSNTAASVLSGTKIAAKQACDFNFHEEESDDFLTKVELKPESKIFTIDSLNVLELNEQDPVIKFERNGIKFYIAPVLVCKNPVKTVGLGDAISSTALLHATFN